MYFLGSISEFNPTIPGFIKKRQNRVFITLYSSFIYLFIRQVFTECPLHAQHCYGRSRSQSEQDILRLGPSGQLPMNTQHFPEVHSQFSPRTCLALKVTLSSVLWDPPVLLLKGPSFQHLSQIALDPFLSVGYFPSPYRPVLILPWRPSCSVAIHFSLFTTSFLRD